MQDCTALLRVHPSTGIDIEKAARVVAASINCHGPYWDLDSCVRRPDLKWEGAFHAADILMAVREHMADIIPCSYRGDDLTHPDAQKAIHDWCRKRAEDKAEQLGQLEVHEDGTIFVERVIGCRPENLRSDVGVFWTTDVQHGGILNAPWAVDDTEEMLVTARVHHSHVDWQKSCMARMDWYSGDCELELRLLPGRPLRDVAAWTWNQSLIVDARRRLILPDMDWTS